MRQFVCLALFAGVLSCLPLKAEDVPLSEQLAGEERSLEGLEKRAEESMRQIVQEDKQNLKVAAFSSEMAKQSQELKVVKNFELLGKAITEQKQRLTDNKRLSPNVRTKLEVLLGESAKRLEQLRHRADNLQKRLEKLEKAADQWGADYAQMRQIDEKEALSQLRKAIHTELKDLEQKTATPRDEVSDAQLGIKKPKQAAQGQIQSDGKAAANPSHSNVRYN